MGRELQVICLPFFFYSPLGHIQFFSPFHLSVHLLSTSLLAHNPPHLIPLLHAVKTKIHQKSGGIATDTTAACMCACLLWSGWILLAKRFQTLPQLIGTHTSYFPHSHLLLYAASLHAWPHSEIHAGNMKERKKEKKKH